MNTFEWEMACDCNNPHARAHGEAVALNNPLSNSWYLAKVANNPLSIDHYRFYQPDKWGRKHL